MRLHRNIFPINCPLRIWRNARVDNELCLRLISLRLLKEKYNHQFLKYSMRASEDRPMQHSFAEQSWCFYKFQSGGVTLNKHMARHVVDSNNVDCVLRTGSSTLESWTSLIMSNDLHELGFQFVLSIIRFQTQLKLLTSARTISV